MDGNTLIQWGFKPGPWFKNAVTLANDMAYSGASLEAVKAAITKLAPVETVKLAMHETALPFAVFACPETADEIASIENACAHMEALMKVPTVVSGALMPDACPAGFVLGTIPVGGIVACKEAIHPAYHSADICCSVAITVLDRNVSAGAILDAAEKISHFGPGGRFNNDAENNQTLVALLAGFQDNPFLQGLTDKALRHFMTQGDGNHFFFVGEMNNQTVIVTHHGSRGLGADLYKRGKETAEQMTKMIAPSVPKHMAWIPSESTQGKHYWEALQDVRAWTELSHFAIHDAVLEHIGAKAADRWWNEHNFIFQKSDGLFYHAKGATPNFKGYADDDIGLTLIPLNMAAGILVADHRSSNGMSAALEFCPHGAGRNISRSEHIRRLAASYGDDLGMTNERMAEVLKRETSDLGIDTRFWSGCLDLAELPSAYKNADQIIDEIETHGLTQIIHKIEPLGSIMAGNDPRDWKAIKAQRKLVTAT